MSNDQRREDHRFFNIYELPWDTAAEPAGVAGLEQRLISRDSATGASTLMVRVPAGWEGAADAETTVGLFVLEGDLDVDGHELRVTGYAHVPPSAGAVPLSSRSGAQAYVFWTPEMEIDPGAVRITSFWDAPWEEGLLNKLPQRWKSLRQPDPADGPIHGSPSGLLRVMQWMPGFVAPMVHVHSVWEEVIFLCGDWIAGERGAVAPGSYLGTPAGYWHAPVPTRTGALAIVHADKPLDLEQRECDGGPELTRAYLDEMSMLEAPAHGELDFLERFDVELSELVGSQAAR